MGRRQRIQRINQEDLIRIVTASEDRDHVTDADQAEMAIPSYLHRKPLIRSIFWHRYDWVNQLADIQSDMTVCEFGCGIGVYLPTLVEEAKQVFAVDLFPHFARRLVDDFNLGIKIWDSLDDIPDAMLDVLIAVEVMEHLDDPVTFTRLFRQKLKPGGRLIMSGPTESWLYKLGRFMVGYHRYHDYHEHNVYELRKIIAANGFTLEKTLRYPSPLLPLFLISAYHVSSEQADSLRS